MVAVLTIAGSDPSGGAGIQADLKTFHQHGVFGTTVITLITAQNTVGVERVELISPATIAAQLSAVCGDIKLAAAKTGALGCALAIELVADAAAQFPFPLIVDPVMVSKHGHALLPQADVEVLIDRLLPRAFLVTPNHYEAELLAKSHIFDLESLKHAALKIQQLGAKNVLVKGPTIDGLATDYLLTENGEGVELSFERLATSRTHGSGCVFSAAITARLAQGDHLIDAIRKSKRFVFNAIANAPQIGNGHCPLNLFVNAPLD